MNRSILIIIVVVLVAAAAAFATGNWPGVGRGSVAAMHSSLDAGSHASLAMFGAQNGGGAGAEEDQPGDEGGEEAEPPADETGDQSAEEGGDEGGGEEAGSAEDENGDGSAAEEEGSGEDESGTEAGGEEGAGDEEAGADEETSDEEAAAGEEETAGGEEEEAAVDDPVENFKNLDPRDIIIKKYDDLDERKTEPWNPDKEGFIPNTGRSDPLTRVRSAVPDELKPPRAGETDMNEINTYLVAAQASMIVDTISSIVQCHNVIQIGLERYATFTFGDDTPASIPEGSSFSFSGGNVNGIPIIVSLTVTSISTKQVVLDISASGQGTTTTVSKTKVFIPSKYY